ncbi:MAG: ATP-binding protein [Myxococcota bacterium]|nr:ATP-binding protein [Myxococcota bacterium]
MSDPHPDDVAFIADALDVLRCRCRLELAEREVAGLVPRDPVDVVSGQESDPEAIRVELRAAEANLQTRLEASDAPTSLLQLQDRFGLSDFERDVVLMALAPSLDGSFNGLYGRLKGASYRSPLEVDVVLAVLGGDIEDRIRHRAAFAPNAPLLSHNLLLVGRGGGAATDDFLGLELRLPARIVSTLIGDSGVDPSLHGFSQLIEPTETLAQVVLPAAEKSRIVELVAHYETFRDAMGTWGLDEVVGYGRGVVLLFCGPSGTGKTLTARAVANHLERRLLAVDASRLTSGPGGFQANLDNLFREAHLQNTVLFFDECEALFSAAGRGTGQLSALLAGLERFAGVTILATNVPKALDSALDRRVLYRVDFEIPTPSMREAIWRLHLPEPLPVADDVDVSYLGRRFEFSGGYIKNAVLLAAQAAAMRQGDDGTAAVSQEDLLYGAYTQLRHRLNRYADRDVVHLRLDDLILPDDVSDQVREIIEAVSAQQIVLREWGFDRKFSKGLGLSALFDGDPGTGKTLCAEVIASELGLNLYRVNVANIVSKYIGETEKNLTRVFAEARSAHAVLLFDEADSLFSKRVEVKHANDRFANMEVNTLLQLVERHDGLVLLTTNLKTSLDSAFERRLSFKVNFPFPDEDTRAMIWQRLIPKECPIADDIDFEELGENFELSGGHIKNAVVRAAYRAAARNGSIRYDDVEFAAEQECKNAGKLFRSGSSRSDDW